MSFHSISTEKAISMLNSSRRGLSKAALKKNVATYGKNVLTPKKEKGFWFNFLSALKEPMILILVFAWTITFGINLGKLIKNGSGSFYECLGILLAILLSTVLTVVMEGRSKKAFKLLSSLGGKTAVKVKRDDMITFIPKSELTVGDVVILEAGDKIFADGRVLYSESLKTDESSLTGESRQIAKFANKIFPESTAISERSNSVFSGTFCTAGGGEYIVTAVGDNAELGKIAAGVVAEKTVSAPLNEKLKRLGKLVSIMGAAASLLVFILSLIRLIILNEVSFDSVQNIFIEAIVLIVAAVPEGLPATVAVTLTLNVVRLAKSNALIKKLVATETVGCVSVICSDKTGTLTANKMTVDKLVTSKKIYREKEFLDRLVVLNAALNSTAELDYKGECRGSHTEGALLLAMKKSGIDYQSLRKKWKIVSRIPFSSEIKYMETIVESASERHRLLKGAPEIIIEKCKLSDSKKRELLEKIKVEQSKAKRVIAFARITDEGCIFDGYASLEDKLRADVLESVKNCNLAGIEVKILTGDNLETACAVAEKLNLLNKNKIAISAEKIEKLTDNELIGLLPSIAVIARSTPNTKLRVVTALQKLNEVVAVTGDGVNDAPAVRHADIGIAMGDGSEVTKEAADIVLLDNSFSTIVKAVAFGRNVYQNFQRFISFQLTVNLASMSIIITYLIMGLESPFSSTCLLWLNVIMDGPLALSLALESRGTLFMENKPVQRNDNILSLKILVKTTVHALFMAAVVTIFELYNFLGVEPEAKGTVTITMFVFFQLFNAINCRELRYKSALNDFFANKLLIIMLVATFLLHITLVEVFPSFFKTASLPFIVWVKLTFICSSILTISETIKWIYRKFFTSNGKNKKIRQNFGSTFQKKPTN